MLYEAALEISKTFSHGAIRFLVPFVAQQKLLHRSVAAVIAELFDLAEQSQAIPIEVGRGGERPLVRFRFSLLSGSLGDRRLVRRPISRGQASLQGPALLLRKFKRRFWGDSTHR